MRHHTHHSVINGSYGEGGGALLRTVLVMSALTQTPVRIHSIRGALRKPGLNSEDLTFLGLIASCCRATVEGDALESKELMFTPSRSPRGIHMECDVASFEKGITYGSTCVIAQALIPVLARGGTMSVLKIAGETSAPNMLSYDAFERSTLWAHRQQGVCAFPHLIWAGFGSGSKGEMSLEIEPSAPQGIQWSERGNIQDLRVILSHSDIHEDIFARGIEKSHELLPDAEVEVIDVKGRSPGISVTVICEFENGSGSFTVLGQKGVRIETIVKQVVEQYAAWKASEATVDEFLADQILPLAVLASSPTSYITPKVTRRLMTMAWIIKQFIPVHISIKGQEGFPGKVTVER